MTEELFTVYNDELICPTELPDLPDTASHSEMGAEQSHYPYLERQLSDATGKDVGTLRNHHSQFRKDCPDGLLSPLKFTELCVKVLGSPKVEEFKNTLFKIYRWRP